MKLKFIKDNEVVISKAEYQLLKTTNYQMQDLINAIRYGDPKYGKPTYYIDYGLYYPVVKVINNVTSFPIKCFNSDDPEYNRVCAEELCELLNQKQ